jgi:carboxymuconolactone decarboxylase family protein
MKTLTAMTVVFLTASVGTIRGDEPGSAPRPIPLTRPEMKQLIEDMKSRKPRIPLPELTEEEKTKLGERGGGYEGRLRYHYMTAGDLRVGLGNGGFGGGGGRARAGTGAPGGPARAGAERARAGGGGVGGPPREQDPKMSLDYAFKTELFWIASRANNCQYCMGHQESKLLNAGLKEDEIAALDGDWSEFTPAQRAAFALARRLTSEPQNLNDADFDAVRKHFNDLQILEMVVSVAGNNSINRWKEGVGVPQSANGGAEIGRRAGAEAPATPRTYLTPTSDKYKDKISRVAAVTFDEKTGLPTRLTVCQRPPLESRADVEKALAQCRSRSPRLPVVDDDKARQIVSENWPAGPLPQWVRLLANFPRDGVTWINGYRASEEKGDLKPRLKAQVSWIVARQDRAWYALGLARNRLRELGLSDQQIDALDGDWSEFTPAEAALFTVARKLAASPVVLTDDEVARAVKLAGPRDVVQLISYTTNRASFDRITEAARLRLEE